MNNRRLEELANAVWEKGIYLSTHVREHVVVNSYAYADQIIDISYCVEAGTVVAVDVDDFASVYAYYIPEGPAMFRIHPN